MAPNEKQGTPMTASQFLPIELITKQAPVKEVLVRTSMVILAYFIPWVANRLTQIDKYIESPDFPMPIMRKSNEICCKPQLFFFIFSLGTSLLIACK